MQGAAKGDREEAGYSEEGKEEEDSRKKVERNGAKQVGVEDSKKKALEGSGMEAEKDRKEDKLGIQGANKSGVSSE